MFLLSFYQQKTTKNCQNFLAKYLKDQCIERNIKHKVKIKNTTDKYRYYLESSFVGVNRLFFALLKLE